MKNKNSKIWWNLILWTASVPSTWPKVFSQKLVWSGEIHYTNIVVLDLFWRWEVKLRFLRNEAFHCVFIRLHGNIFSNLKKRNWSHKLSTQTTRQPSISSAIEDHRQIIVATNDSVSRLSLYADWLAPKHKPHDMIPGVSCLRTLLQCSCINFHQLRYDFVVPWFFLLSFVVL